MVPGSSHPSPPTTTQTLEQLTNQTKPNETTAMSDPRRCAMGARCLHTDEVPNVVCLGKCGARLHAGCALASRCEICYGEARADSAIPVPNGRAQPVVEHPLNAECSAGCRRAVPQSLLFSHLVLVPMEVLVMMMRGRGSRCGTVLQRWHLNRQQQLQPQAAAAAWVLMALVRVLAVLTWPRRRRRGSES